MSDRKSKKINKGIFLLIPFLLTAFFVFYTNKVLFAQEETLSSDAQDQLETLEDKADKYKRMIELSQQQQKTLQNQLALMRIQEESLQYDVSVQEGAIKKNNEEIESIKNKIAEIQGDIERSRNELGEVIRTYDRIDQEMTMEMLSNKRDLSEIFDRSTYLSQASKGIETALGKIQEEKTKLDQKQSQLQEETDQLEQNKKELEEKVSFLNNEKRNKDILIQKTKGEETKYQQLLADIQTEIYNLEVGKSVDYDNIPAAKGGYFDYPVSKVAITQGYGMTSFAKSGAYNGKAHNGIDFGVSFKSVYAAREGRVLNSGDNGGYAYGKWIAIDHGDGLVTLYGHLSSKSVSKGDKVKKGEKIGVSGNTGFSTGPHLHFSVFDKKSFSLSESKLVEGLMIPNGASINPMRYF